MQHEIVDRPIHGLHESRCVSVKKLSAKGSAWFPWQLEMSTEPRGRQPAYSEAPVLRQARLQCMRSLHQLQPRAQLLAADAAAAAAAALAAPPAAVGLQLLTGLQEKGACKHDNTAEPLHLEILMPSASSHGEQ